MGPARIATSALALVSATLLGGCLGLAPTAPRADRNAPATAPPPTPTSASASANTPARDGWADRAPDNAPASDDACTRAPEVALDDAHGARGLVNHLDDTAPIAAMAVPAGAVGAVRLRLNAPVALTVQSDRAFALFVGGCDAPMPVAARDAHTADGDHRALYTLGPGEHLLVSAGEGTAAAVSLAWVTLPAGRDHVGWGRWGDAPARLPVSAGGVGPAAGYAPVCQREAAGRYVHLLWDADGTGPATRRFVLDRLGGMRTPADGALCAQVLTATRGLVALEAHRMGSGDALTHFVTTE